MSDRKLPPPLQALFDALTANGIDVEVIGLGGKDSSTEREPTAAEAELGITKSELALLHTLQEGLSQLHGHLCPRIKALDKKLEEVDARSLRRDNTMRDLISDLTERARIQDLDNTRVRQELDAAGALIAELQETVRRQVGLLHKRVTKRKAEIATKTTKRRRGPQGQSVSTTG